jgi:hypothetical protein
MPRIIQRSQLVAMETVPGAAKDVYDQHRCCQS